METCAEKNEFNYKRRYWTTETILIRFDALNHLRKNYFPACGLCSYVPDNLRALNFSLPAFCSWQSILNLWVYWWKSILMVMWHVCASFNLEISVRDFTTIDLNSFSQRKFLIKGTNGRMVSLKSVKLLKAQFECLHVFLIQIFRGSTLLFFI